MVENTICEESLFYLMDDRFIYERKSEFVDFLESNITNKIQKRWFAERIAKWRDNTNPHYLETLTRNGIGFTFNTFPADELLEKSM